MLIPASSLLKLETDNGQSSGSPFRSWWFIWRTLEFVLALGAVVFVLGRYWSKVSEHISNILVLVIGIFMLVFPYSAFIRTCRELHEICLMAESWEEEHKVVIMDIVAITKRAIGGALSRYFTTVLMLIILVTYCFIR